MRAHREPAQRNRDGVGVSQQSSSVRVAVQSVGERNRAGRISSASHGRCQNRHDRSGLALGDGLWQACWAGQLRGNVGKGARRRIKAGGRAVVG